MNKLFGTHKYSPFGWDLLMQSWAVAREADARMRAQAGAGGATAPEAPSRRRVWPRFLTPR